MKTCWNVVTESCLATGPEKHQIALSQGCYLSLWQGSHSIDQHTLDAEQKLVGDQIYCGHSGDKGKNPAFSSQRWQRPPRFSIPTHRTIGENSLGDTMALPAFLPTSNLNRIATPEPFLWRTFSDELCERPLQFQIHFAYNTFPHCVTIFKGIT